MGFQKLSDNGPQFASEKFRQFLKDWEIQYDPASPRYPKANGMAESAVKSVKSLFKKAHKANEDPYLALLNHRATPNNTDGLSPAKKLMNRELNTRLSNIKQSVNTTANKEISMKLQLKKEKQKEIYNRKATDLLSSLDQLDVRTAKSVQTFDFSTLYTSIPHDLLKSRISNLVHNAFRKKDGSVRYTHIKLTRAKGYFTHDINGGGDNMFTADSICEMIEFLIDNIFVQFGGRLFRQVIGIPMGTNCAPLLADLFLYSYENEFLDNMIRSGHRRLARSFNLCYRYIDDLIVFNNKRFLDYLKEIYPSQLTVEKANKSDHLADYLDLTFIIDSGGKLSTRLYDKRDDFDFHIVNFPFLSSNIPSGPSYGVYISQLIRYARCCSHYDDFRYRHKCLVGRLLSQGYKALRLEKSFKKFYGRYQDLIEKYRRSVNAMVSDSFPGQFLFNM